MMEGTVSGFSAFGISTTPSPVTVVNATSACEHAGVPSDASATKSIRNKQAQENDVSRDPQGIVLELPPTQNRAIMPVKIGGKTCPARAVIRHTRTARSWMAKARKDVADSGLVPFTGPVTLTVFVHPPRNSRPDVDGYIKKIMDVLQATPETNGRGMYVNDYWVTSLHVYRYAVSDNPRAEVLGEQGVRYEEG